MRFLPRLGFFMKVTQFWSLRLVGVLHTALLATLVMVPGFLGTTTALGLSDYPEASRFAGSQLRKVELLSSTGARISLAPAAGEASVLIPVFTSCPVTCPTILKDFQAALEEAKPALKGAKFRVLVVSFDPADTLESFRSLVSRQKLPREWNYAIARPGKNFKDFESLLASLDFRYKKLPGSAGGFAHPAGAYIFDSSGMIRRFLAQAEFTGEDIVDGIVGSNSNRGPVRGKPVASPGNPGRISAGSHPEHMDHR